LILGNFIKKNKLGVVLQAPFGVILDDFDAPQPDLMFVSNAKRAIIQSDGIFGVLDLIVEIISPSSIKIDKFDKFKTYEKFGVTEYWLVDTKNQSLEIHFLQQGKYELMALAVEKGIVKSLVLPDLEIEVSEIFMN
jgi:Uma2 family endonuclease